MNRVCSIFSQILQFVPRLEFEAAVQKAKHRQHGFASWDQFGAMMFCQLGHAQSLREITGGLASCEGKLKHLGMDGAPARSTLAYANENRPWQLYQDVFQTLLGRCQHEAQNHKRKFRFKHKLLSIDGTMVELSLSVFDLAVYKRTKGALKLHMVLDHDGYLPCYAVVTDGKESEISVAKSMTFQPGTMLVFDRGYPDHDWWLSLRRSTGNSRTALKDNVRRDQRECRADPDLDGADRHAPAEIPPNAQHLCLELLPSGGDDTTSAIRLPRPDDLAEQSFRGSPGAGGDPRPAVAAGLCS